MLGGRPGRPGRLLVERLAVADAAAQELGPLGNDRKRIRFLGKQENVEEILSIADLFLIPSGSETFGLAALEAMSCSVPVISSNIGGLPEVNVHGETGYLCDLDDVDCMAEYAVNILSDEDLYKKLSQNARKRAEQYEMSDIITQYEEYYTSIREMLLEDASA